FGHGGAVTLVGLEQQPLEVGRHHDIHGGRQSRLELLLREVVGCQGAVQDVVGVGGDDEALHRQPHAVGHVAGEDVAEVGRGHAEAHLALRRAQRHGGGHVVDDLGHDARPVDGVDRHQAGAIQEGLVGEARLDHRLGVVEVALDGDVEDVVRQHRGHLAALYLRDPVVGVEDEDVEVVAVAAALDGGRAGVAGGRPHDHRPLAALLQEVVEDAAQQLQRHVLEG
ncbi:hypothetical protein AOG27_20945, partial [Pseudoalteromonas lipolytica]